MIVSDSEELQADCCYAEPMKEHFISVDIETAGPIPGKFSLLTIGACSVDDDNICFSASLKPLNTNAVPEALQVTGLSLAELANSGEAPAKVMNDFAAWIHRTTGDARVPVFVGLNAPFDWSFINYYFHEYLSRNPFGIAALDIKALYMGKTGCKWSESTSDKMVKRLNPVRRGTHDALDDALFQAELFRLILSRSA